MKPVASTGRGVTRVLLWEEYRAAHPDGPDAFRYDRRCASLSPADVEVRSAAGAPYTIRFRVPEGATTWRDAVHGDISFDNTAIEDFIVLRTDGTPIYNLAVVSDDIDMRITHVIRGDDHISNTPKQIMLYEALGAPLIGLVGPSGGVGVVTAVGKVGGAVGRVRIYGLAGPSWHRATFTTRQTFEETTLPGGTQTYQWRTEGWGLTFGGGTEVWISSRFALFGEGSRLEMKGTDVGNGDAETDVTLTSAIAGVRFRIGG